MKKLLPAFLILISVSSFAQTLVSYNLIKTYTPEQIDSILAANGIPGLVLPSTYSINIYHVIYNTLDADSLPIIASGALFVPVNPLCKVPLASYQHGTIASKTSVPSTLNTLEVLIGETSSTDGFAVCMPDYLGLGDSPGLHPYVHAATEARATADLLVVATQILDELEITWNGQLFLFGYSQGGHATMAAHQLIQESYSNYFTVSASAPMSGPYDISGIQSEVISADNPYPNPGYLPYFLLAYNSVYDIYPTNSDFLKAPYDSLLPPLFDGTHELSEVNAVMPSIPNEIVVPAVLDSFNNDSTYRLRTYLKLNDTYNWAPVNPLRMFYCEGDMDVNYQNAFVAYDHLVANGSSVISKMSSGNFDHSGCVFPSLLNVKSFFDSLRLDKLKLNFDVHAASSPNASDGLLIVHASSGSPPYTYAWNNGVTDSVNANLNTGLFSVTVTDATGCPSTSQVYLGVQVGIDEVFAQQTILSPNPMVSMTSIQFPVEEKYSLDLSDAFGKKVFSDKFAGKKYALLRKNLPPGIYFVTIKKDDGLPFVKMLVMQ